MVNFPFPLKLVFVNTVTEKDWGRGIDVGLIPVVMGMGYKKDYIIPG